MQREKKQVVVSDASQRRQRVCAGQPEVALFRDEKQPTMIGKGDKWSVNRSLSQSKSAPPGDGSASKHVVQQSTNMLLAPVTSDQFLVYVPFFPMLHGKQQVSSTNCGICNPQRQWKATPNGNRKIQLPIFQ